jgi:hypothetical protein
MAVEPGAGATAPTSCGRIARSPTVFCDAGAGLRGSARKRGAQSRTRWVTEQNSKTKQPRRGRAVLVVVEVQPKKKQAGLGKPMAELFVLIGTFNG